MYSVFFGQTIFASDSSKNGREEERGSGSRRVQREGEEFSVNTDSRSRTISAVAPVTINSMQDLANKFIPLSRQEVVEVYDDSFRTRGSDVVIERVLNFVYILRADVTGSVAAFDE